MNHPAMKAAPNGHFDVAIMGGGLAGLALTLLCARAGYKVVLFEKEIYPFHKVCGEYLSAESQGFLLNLGLDLEKMDLPIITQLEVTAGKQVIKQSLQPGGFGISRYLLDHTLYLIAERAGVKIYQGAKVKDIHFDNNEFTVSAGNIRVTATVAAGTFGKRSNIDVKWARDFIRHKPGPLNNFLAVKYHVEVPFPPGTIALHNFPGGYCGISRIEENACCLCYLTTAGNLQAAGSIEAMENTILRKDPHLDRIFSSARILPGFPITISQISFDKKSQVENHVLMTGDAAGLITPLCGNGMSMALQGSRIAFDCIDPFLKKEIGRGEMEKIFISRWKKQFAKRLRTGRLLQRFFGKEWLSQLFLRSLKPFPFLVRQLIRATHGRPFQ